MSEWIKFTDKAPDVNCIEYVWACWNGAGTWSHEPKQGLARYSDSMGWQPLGHQGWDWNVTHWMPLPALPAGLDSPQMYQQEK